MRIFTSVFLILLLSVSALAQSKINGLGRIQLEKYNQAAKIQPMSANQSAPEVSVLVSLNDNAEVADIRNAGYTVTEEFNRFAIVTLPISQVENLAELKQVRRVSFGGKRRMLMQHARPASGVDKVHQGIEHNGTTTSFTGNGVVLGLFDGGLDPNHPNFKNTDGTSRVSRLWYYSGNTSSTYTEYNARTISSFTTDDEDETHATHVAGIMGGSYKGTGKYVNHTNPSTGEGYIVNSGNIPYYGIATDAELAFSCGTFYDDCILGGVKKIIDYADTQGKPAVVNLSIGSNYGPHDGTDDFSQVLDELGERGIICVAAGNEGQDNISIHHVCTSAKPTVKTLLFYNNLYTNSNTGVLDIWASDGQPLTVTIANVNSSGSISNATTIKTSSNGTILSKGVKNSGTVYYYSGVDPNNGRYNALFEMEEALPSSGRFSITVTGKPGQEIDIYFSGYSEFSNSYNNSSSNILSGYTAGNPDQSINGMACGKNIIVVGSYNTLSNFRDLSDSGTYSFYENYNEISSFSSYGTDFFGNKLPHVVAPGSAIISSYSRRYVAKGYQYETASDMCASTTYNGKTEYWGPMQGTSMATPYMSGVAALWLEADPNLTVDDMKEVIALTSTSFVTSKATDEQREGHGKLNADKGIAYILGKHTTGAINSVESDEHSLAVLNENGLLSITLAGADGFTATLSDIQGRTVAAEHSPSNQLSISTSALERGIYILRVQSGTKHITRKLVL